MLIWNCRDLGRVLSIGSNPNAKEEGLGRLLCMGMIMIIRLGNI